MRLGGAKINSTTNPLTQIKFASGVMVKNWGRSEKTRTKGGKAGMDFGNEVETRGSAQGSFQCLHRGDNIPAHHYS